MPHATSQHSLHHPPHAVSHQLPHPASQPVVQLQQRQEMANSTETLSQPEVLSNVLPVSTNTLRSSSPKPDPSELYLKSKAMLDSKRKLFFFQLYLSISLISFAIYFIGWICEIDSNPLGSYKSLFWRFKIASTFKY